MNPPPPKKKSWDNYSGSCVMRWYRNSLTRDGMSIFTTSFCHILPWLNLAAPGVVGQGSAGGLQRNTSETEEERRRLSSNRPALFALLNSVSCPCFLHFNGEQTCLFQEKKNTTKLKLHLWTHLWACLWTANTARLPGRRRASLCWCTCRIFIHSGGDS